MTTVLADPFDLQRFVNAQRDTYAAALGEIRLGHKHGHWMWFVFPQVIGLGQSSIGRRYAIRSRAEAEAYLDHSVLGPRLRECADALLTLPADKTAHAILGFPDDLKLRSSMTLFRQLDGPDGVFQRVLDRYYEGRPDPATIAILDANRAPDGSAP